MLEVNNVTFNYSAHGEQDSPPALYDVSLRIGAGETVAVIGHNGSGKSTLAKLLAAILKPDSGSVLVDGLLTSAGGEDIWTIRQRVGIVFQNPDDQLVANTVIDDIAFGPENLRLPRFEIEERIQEAMALLELEQYAEMAVSELSVGQKQRVAIAGVLAMHPRYLLLDEPTTMISSHTAQHLLNTIQRLAKEQHIAVIHITHFMHEVTTFKRVIVMHEGRLLMDGTPTDVFARADELHEVGLDVPVITSLGQHLRATGWAGLPEVVLSTDQLKAMGQEQARADKAEGTGTGGGRAGASPAPTILPTQAIGPSIVGAGLAPALFTSATSALATSASALPSPVPGLFELKDVHHTYLRGTPFAVEALHGLSLSIPADQTVALVGPTKSGKSTIVDLLAGLIKPATGAFLFEAADVSAPNFNIERIRSVVGVVFQSPEAQIFEDTVGKDVSFGPRRKKVPLAESRRLVQESLEAVGLSYEDFRSRYTYALSGGQKRRVAIAGVLAMQPKVIIFDEPTAGLDPRGRRELLNLIARLKQRHSLTIIYTSSGLEDVIELADCIHILDQGRLAFSGTPREILARLDELATLDIALPEAAQIALELREIFPTIHTGVMNLAELEEEIMQITVGAQFIAPTSRQATNELGAINCAPTEKTHD